MAIDTRETTLSGGSRRAKGSRAWWTGAVVFLLACWPALVSWKTAGVRAAFRFFADDAFYYLAVAHHSAEAGFFTPTGCWPSPV